MWKEILIRTNIESLFIKIVNDGGQTITTGIADSDDVPDRILKSPAGSGDGDLEPHLIEGARLIAASYGVELSEPVEGFITKTAAQNAGGIELSLLQAAGLT